MCLEMIVNVILKGTFFVSSCSQETDESSRHKKQRRVQVMMNFIGYNKVCGDGRVCKKKKYIQLNFDLHFLSKRKENDSISNYN